jgi:hypothetical protein
VNIAAVGYRNTTSIKHIGDAVGGAGFYSAPSQGVDEDPCCLRRMMDVCVLDGFIVMPKLSHTRDKLA